MVWVILWCFVFNLLKLWFVKNFIIIDYILFRKWNCFCILVLFYFKFFFGGVLNKINICVVFVLYVVIIFIGFILLYLDLDIFLKKIFNLFLVFGFFGFCGLILVNGIYLLVIGFL